MTLHISATATLAHFKLSLVSLSAYDGRGAEKGDFCQPAQVISIPSARPLLFSSPHNIAQPKRKGLIGFSAVNWTSPLLGPFCQDPRILFEFKTELEAWEKQLTCALRNRKELF